jgi:hypothetical protein
MGLHEDEEAVMASSHHHHFNAAGAFDSIYRGNRARTFYLYAILERGNYG